MLRETVLSTPRLEYAGTLELGLEDRPTGGGYAL